MMPFSVFRMTFQCLLNLVIVCLVVFCAFDAYQRLDGSNKVDSVVVLSPEPLVERDVTDSEAAIVNEHREALLFRNGREDWIAWTELAVAALCVGISVFGRVPVKLMFNSVPSTDTPALHPGRSFKIARPDGSQLHGKVFGPEKAPTLLLTHGWSLNSSAWNYLIPALVKRYRVVVWDLAGLGESRGPVNGDHSLEKQANDLNAVLEYVSPNGPAILVGHSIGGMTQQTFCRLHRDKLSDIVKGLVLVHTTYTNPLKTNIASAITKPAEPVIKLINMLMIPTAGYIWLSNWQSYFNGSLHIFARFESFTGKQTWAQLDHSARMGAAAWPNVVARGNFGMLKFDESLTLPNINIPVLIISGKNDRLTLESASKKINELLPHGRLISDDGGHLGHWEFNDWICAGINDFAEEGFDSSNRSLDLAEPMEVYQSNSPFGRSI